MCPETERTLTAVKMELYLRKVCRKMFRADLVPDSDDPALQDFGSRLGRHETASSLQKQGLIPLKR